MVGPNEPGGHPLRGLGRAGVVDRHVLEVLRHLLAGVEPLLDLRVRDVAGDHQRPGQRQPGLDRVLGQLGADLVHRPVEVDADDVAPDRRIDVRLLGQVVRRVRLELLEEDALGGDLAQRLPVGGARHRDRDRAGGAVPGEADDADVVAEVLAAELGPDPEGLGQLEDLLLQLEVPEAVGRHAARRRQVVEVVRGGVLRGLQRELRAGAADHHREVVRRARGGAERADLLVEELQHPLGVQDRLGLLEQEGLVGRAAALGHEEELVLRRGSVLDPVETARRGVQLDLRRQVRAGVLLLPHRQRGELGVAQVELGVGVVDALADPLGVVGAGEHALGLLAHHDRGAGVLAHRQHAAGGDVDVLQQVEGDEPVVARGLGVVDDPAQLGEVGGAQVVRDVVHRLGGQRADRLGLHLEEGPTVDLDGADALGRDQPVGGVVGPGRQQVGVAELGLDTHRWCSSTDHGLGGNPTPRG